MRLRDKSRQSPELIHNPFFHLKFYGKKPLETGAPEASAAKKTAARKTTAKKTASTTKKAAAAEKKAAADAVSVEAPKTKIKTVKSAPKTAKTAKKAADEKAPVSETVVAPSEAPAPSAPVEKEMMPEAPQKPQAAAPVKVKRESFRPNRNAEQQERHEQHGGDVFAQPETVGGASEGPFNKRKRRRRNKKGGGSEDRQPMQDAASLKQLDCKKVASRAWKMFLAEVSEEGLALMDDQTAREAARRAFRCAEFFMMEEARRKHAQKAALQQQEKTSSPEEERDSEEDSGEE